MPPLMSVSVYVATAFAVVDSGSGVAVELALYCASVRPAHVGGGGGDGGGGLH